MQFPDILLPIEKSNGEFSFFSATPEDLSWPQLRSIWEDYSVELPLGFFPPETKLDVFFYYACQEHGVPASLSSVFNPGLADYFFGKVKHDCLILTGDLLPYLVSNKLFGRHLGGLKVLVSIEEEKTGIAKQKLNIKEDTEVINLPHPVETIEQ